MSKAKKVAIGTAIGAVVLVGGAYVASYFIAGNQLPAKASVDGVAIGGLSPAQAEQKLSTELAPKIDTPIKLNAGSTSVTIQPAQAGLGANYAETVRNAGGGFSWNPSDILRTFTGGEEIALVRTVDQDALTKAVEAEADQFKVDAVDATVKFDNGSIARTDGKDAQELDVPAAVAAVADAYEKSAGNAEAPLEATPPAVTTAMVDDVVKAFADPLMSGPIVITHGEQKMEVAPGAVAAATTFAVEGDKIVAKVDEAALFDGTAESRRALKLNEPKNAGYTYEAGAAKVVPAVTGEKLEPAAFHEAVMKAATATGDARTVPVETVEMKPEFSTEQAGEAEAHRGHRRVLDAVPARRLPQHEPGPRSLHRQRDRAAAR